MFSFEGFSQEVDLDLEDPDDINMLLEDLEGGDEKAPSTTAGAETKVVQESDLSDLEKDLEELNFDEPDKTEEKAEQTLKSEEDDLEALKEDLGDLDFDLPEENEPALKEAIEIDKEVNPSKISIMKIIMNY